MSIKSFLSASLVVPFLLVSTASQAEDSYITVGVAPHGGYVILGGSVIPMKQVTLSAQMPGRVEMVAGEEGDEFSTGAILVAIEDDNLQAKRQAAVAQIKNAQAVLQNASVQYNRELYNPSVYNPRPMAGMGFPSMFDNMFSGGNGGNGMFGGSGGNKGIERHADLSRQGTQLAQARNRITEAQSGLRELDTRIRDAQAIAPFDGIIIRKLVEVGDTVQPGQALLKFSYSKYLRIKVKVPSSLVSGLQKGMVVPARLDIDNTRVSARVAQIAPFADEKHHTVTVKFDLPEGVPGGPGMYAEVMLPDTHSPAASLPVIPNSALQHKGSLPSVRVLDDNNVPKLRLVRTGDQVDDTHITILSGLEAGERILSNPGSFGSGSAPVN